nr:MAG TPA: hypothetical protein [Caudoviricetes sp.]
MKKNYKVQLQEDKFVDYTGELRDFTVCAITKMIDNGKERIKSLDIGIAVRSPEDSWDKELGERIAEGKALKRPVLQLLASEPFAFDTAVVAAHIESVCRYFKKDPGMFIPGYNKWRERWESMDEG